MLYVLTKRVGNMLSLGLSLQNSSAHGLPNTRTRDADSQRHDNVPPEISLAATAIVVLKLVYGLDGKQRQDPLRTKITQTDVILDSPEAQMMRHVHFLPLLHFWRPSKRQITLKVVSTAIGLAPGCLCLS